MIPICDIIIPTYNNEHYTVNCIRSIVENTRRGSYRIIWVDNNSAQPGPVKRALQGYDHVAIRLAKNYGFVGAVNYGISESRAPFVCLLNNDTIVPARWLQKLLNAMTKYPRLGIVGPLTAPPPPEFPKNYDSHHSIRHIEDHAGKRIFPEFKDLQDFNEKIEAAFPTKIMPIAFVAFLCAVIRREVIDAVGLLDNNYAMGMYDDNDYNLAARKAGWETMLLWDTCIKHFGRSTFKEVEKKEGLDVGALLRRNHAYLKRKWGLHV